MYAAANVRGDAMALRLAPWTRDEVIEYLLSVHRDRCAAVMARLRSQDDCVDAAGLPDLWRPVLDRLRATIRSPMRGPPSSAMSPATLSIAIFCSEPAARV